MLGSTIYVRFTDKPLIFAVMRVAYICFCASSVKSLSWKRDANGNEIQLFGSVGTSTSDLGFGVGSEGYIACISGCCIEREVRVVE